MSDEQLMKLADAISLLEDLIPSRPPKEAMKA